MVYKGLSRLLKGYTTKYPGVRKIRGLGGVLCKMEEWGAIRVKME